MAGPISPAPYNSLAEIRQDIVDHQRAQAQRRVLVAQYNAFEAQKAQAMANKEAAEARKQVLVAQKENLESQHAQAMAKKAEAMAKKAEAMAKKEQSQARIAQLNELMKLVQAAPTRPAPAIDRPEPGSPPKA